MSRSLFWTPYKVKMNYQESVLDLPLNWLAKWTMVFLTIMVHTQILANSLGPRTLFWRLLADGINQRSSFICGVCYISQLHTELGLVCKRGWYQYYWDSILVSFSVTMSIHCANITNLQKQELHHTSWYDE